MQPPYFTIIFSTKYGQEANVPIVKHTKGTLIQILKQINSDSKYDSVKISTTARLENFNL